MASSKRWANLGTAAGGMTAVLFAGNDLIQWGLAYARDNFHNDFTFYFAAARLGSEHGWSAIYNLNLLQQELDAMGSGITIAALARYLSPPPVAWAALPLTLLPYPAAYLIWSALLLAALSLVWWLAAPGRGRLRLLHLAAALGWVPVIYCLQLGQPGLFVALGVAGSYALLCSDRRVLAGLALGALVFKPQLAFLVPPALFAAGRIRTFWFSAVALGLLALASVVAIGPETIPAYRALLSTAATVPVNRELTLDYLIGNPAATHVVQIVIAAWTLALVYLLRRREPEWIYVTAIVGGMIASPYMHLDDFLMLGLAAWLCLRANRSPWLAGYLIAAALAIEGEPVWGQLPLLAAELGGLSLLSMMALRPEARRPNLHDGRNPQQTAVHPLPPRPTL